MLLGKNWTAQDLLRDVQNVCIERVVAGDTDEWADYFCDFLEGCVI